MLTVKEVASRLGVSGTTVYSLVMTGKLRCYRIGLGRGAIRISEDDLAAYMEGCRSAETVGASLPSHPVQLKHLTL